MKPDTMRGNNMVLRQDGGDPLLVYRAAPIREILKQLEITDCSH